MSQNVRIPTQPDELASYMDNTDDYQLLNVPPINYTRWQWTPAESAQWHTFRLQYDKVHNQINDVKNATTTQRDAEKILNKAIHDYDHDKVTGHKLLDKIALFGTQADCETFRVKKGTVLADTTATKQAAPGIKDVTITIKENKHLITRLIVVAAGQEGRGKQAGVKDIMVFKAITGIKDPAPSNKLYQYVGDVKRGLITVTHDESDEGSKAWFIARIKNSKGEIGAPSKAESVVVM